MRTLSIFAALALAACSGSSSTTTSTGGTGSGTGTTATTSSGGSHTSSGTSASSAAAGATSSGSASTTTSSSGAAFTGNVQLGATAFGSSTIYSASAAFYTGSGPGDHCALLSGTSCCYAAPVTGTTSSSTPVSAGSIALVDVTASNAALGTLAYTTPGMTNPNGYSSLSSETTSALTWNANDVISATAAGDATGVGAFSGTITAEAALTGISPALSLTSPTPTPVTLASGITITWTAGTSGNVTLNLIDTGASGTTDNGSVVCSAPVTAGTLTVPASALSHFASGDKGEAIFQPSLSVTPSTAPSNASVTISLTAAGAEGAVSYQ